MTGVLLNFSGHPLCQEAASILEKRFEKIVNSKPIEFDFAADVEAQLTRVIHDIPYKLDGSRPITVIPPGQATLAILLVSYLHGIVGHFPSLCYLEARPDGLYLPKVEYVLSVQSVRSAGRKWRAAMFAV